VFTVKRMESNSPDTANLADLADLASWQSWQSSAINYTVTYIIKIFELCLKTR